MPEAAEITDHLHSYFCFVLRCLFAFSAFGPAAFFGVDPSCRNLRFGIFAAPFAAKDDGVRIFE